MKAFIISDIHLEFYTKNQIETAVSIPIIKRATGCEILIIAGDLTISKQLDKLDLFLSQIKNNFTHIIYVLGNHDYYYADFNICEKLHLNIISKYNNVHLLNNSHITINDRKIIGTTLFTGDRYDIYMKIFSSNMSDFHVIGGWNVDKMNDVFDINYRYLSSNIDDNSIVITHHLPLNQCISPKFKSSDLNRYFAVNIPELVERTSVWIYGHTHDYANFKFRNCELFCNPMGYPEEHTKIQNYIIEV